MSEVKNKMIDTGDKRATVKVEITTAVNVNRKKLQPGIVELTKSEADAVIKVGCGKRVDSVGK